MGIKSFRPVTASSRGTKLVSKDGLWKGGPLKILTEKKKSKAGRNNMGHITVRRRGGGHKKVYRVIDFKRNKVDMPATVERIEYDPNRTAFIALLKYKDGIFSYIIAPDKLKTGDVVSSSKKNALDVRPGNAMTLALMPIGAIIHNIETKPGAGGSFVRSAGNFAQLVGKDDGYATVKLQSGETRIFPLSCMASVGGVSNLDKKNEKIGKAGRARWLGRRPKVRGESMNPVDHPLGGRTRGGRHPVSPTGVCAKGGRTRKKSNPSNRFIVSSRHKNKR
ncbi:MAG: 50S ribosomal protein L2 [Rickettsiales bacterium]|jgi:large subunit ribosomal protein L2|nr:50S ribosomal protein L2 [Rickettsiales bacterium]